MVYFAAKGSHKKAKEAEEAKTKVEEAISEIQAQIEVLPLVLGTVKARKYAIGQLCNALISDILKFTRIIRPRGIFSVVKQKLLSLLGKNPYTLEQSEALGQLNLSVTRFLVGFRINDESGQNAKTGNQLSELQDSGPA